MARSDATDAWPRPVFLHKVHSGGGVLGSYVPARPNLSFGRLDLNALQPNSRTGSLTARSSDSLFSEILSGRSGARPILWGQPAPTDAGAAPLPSARTAPVPVQPPPPHPPSTGRGGRAGPPNVTPRRSMLVATDPAPPPLLPTPTPTPVPAAPPYEGTDDASRGRDNTDLSRASTTGPAASTTPHALQTAISTSHAHAASSRQTTPPIIIPIGRSSARQSPVPSELISRPPTRHTPAPAAAPPVAPPLQQRTRRPKPKKKYMPGLQSWPWPEQGPPRVCPDPTSTSSIVQQMCCDAV
jgi:hypothetical protein